MHTQPTSRRARRLAFFLFCGIVSLAESAQAGDTIVFSDGDFGGGWVSNKIVDTTPSAGATFVSTTQFGGIPGSYRNTSHTYNNGTIFVAHIDAQYAHDPSTTPICSIDFAPALIHFTGSPLSAVSYRVALRQAGSTYGGPSIDVYDTFWSSHLQSGLHSEDFQLYAGSGPTHPDFTCTGSTIEFGFLTGNSAGGGPITTVSGIDNWLVTVHLDSATYSDDTLINGLWIPFKVLDTTPAAAAIWSNSSFATGGNPTDYRQTVHQYWNGQLILAHLYSYGFHDPAVEPVYTVDFSTDARHESPVLVGQVIVRPAVWQGSGYYMGPQLFVFSGTWGTYALSGLTASDFVLVAGGGPVHPNFTNSGSLMQFGYMTETQFISVGGPGTKAIGIDNWVVKANLAPPCPGELGSAACFGDDVTNPCPCFPSVPLGGVGRGCPNSIEPRGALLIGTGTASIANDTVILQATSMPNSFCMYFQGTTLTGVPFGDGRLCAAGTIVRLAVKLNICNSSQYPASNEPTISVQGGIVTPGQRIYQIWYRDAAVFCTPTTFNLTNALAITWNP